jgi:RNA polymerase sigma-70 factor (ECF subfamily)
MMEITETLLTRLGDGDVAATEALVEAFTPYLRAIIRRQLSDRMRSQFDSGDVLQSVWVQVVRQLNRDGWQVMNAEQLRGLLATIARRRLVTCVRRNLHAPTAIPDSGGWDTLPQVGQPRPSELAQADELWRTLLDLCPPEHHEVLILRRKGLLLEEIAERTGLHEGSVRRILRRVARELALRQQPVAGLHSTEGDDHVPPA